MFFYCVLANYKVDSLVKDRRFRVRIFAREREVKILEKVYHSKQPEFLAIYGRRRIGKTFLMRQFFKEKGTYFELTGIKKGSYKHQLHSFITEFFRVFGKKPSHKVSNWLEAFDELRTAIEQSAHIGRIILFFDELPWLATPKSNFIQALDHFWNRYMSDDPRIILIVCGSAASWMIKKIICDKGGLHGRLTEKMRLLPFDLEETEKFLVSRGIMLDRKQLIDIYMAIGGVAKYLTYIEPGQSSLLAVNRICFDGPLFKEFDELYSSLFTNYTQHIAVVRALAGQTCGLTKSQICEKTDIVFGGGLIDILHELEESGFINSSASFEKKKNDIRFRLIDEYSLFYIKWIEQAKSVDLKGLDENYWLKVRNSPVGYAWFGYAFEILCLKHIRKIKEALGISGVITRESAWVYKPRADDGKGAQIDLLIDRADNCINLCEIKYVNDVFTIDKDSAMQLRSKKNIFIEKTKSKKSIFLTLITPYGVKKNGASLGVVDVELNMDDLF